ncbi:hypothetical protein FRX31_027734 [Thalictrum thalictroides]|uniref:Uncharacterized protein n=1 Tax=Thalictrum thalictroides TaxID=46969 RepID=A0A7J6VEN9_THATH|nr:hypothetical protein FRX31_027734 [Thalictrum thalictroides]
MRLDMTDSRSHKRMNGTPGESAERDGSDTGMPSDPPQTPCSRQGFDRIVSPYSLMANSSWVRHIHGLAKRTINLIRRA